MDRLKFNELYDNRPGPKIMQDRRELFSLYRFINQNKIETYLEIGSRNGGSFSVLARACEPKALVIALDDPGGLWGDPESVSDLFSVNKSLMKDGYNSCLVLGDSHKHRNWTTISESILKGRALDILFIDGDHTYEGCRKDVLDYSVLLKKDGFIVLHDIDPDAPPHPKGPLIGVSRLWSELKTVGPYREFKTSGSLMGIGIVQVGDGIMI